MMAPRKVRTKRKVRAELAWGLAVFACLQVGVLALMEHRQELRDPEFANRLACLRRRLAEEPDRPLVLLLGTSRTEMGFRPEVLGPLPTAEGPAPLMFNFGIAGNEPVKEAVCLKRLLEAGIRPQHLFLEVLPGNLVLWRETVEDSSRNAWVGWQDLPVLQRCGARAWPLYAGWFGSRLVPCHSYRLLIQNQITPGQVPLVFRRSNFWQSPDRLGWMPTALPNSDRLRLVECNRGQFAEALKRIEVGASADRAMREMLDRSRSEGIRVTLLLMPESSAFRGWYSAESWAGVEAYLDRLAREYDVAVVNARDWVPDEGFVDSHHLGAEGARIFTRRLAREVLVPLAAGAGPEGRTADGRDS